MKSTMDLDVLWAKSDPYHKLWKHMLDAAAVSLALRNPLEKVGWSPEQVAWVVGMHDVGKADAQFQHQIANFRDQLCAAGYRETGDARCRHERLSATFVKQCLKDNRCADTVQRALIAHHGHWEEGGRDVGEVYAKAQAELSEMLREALRLPGVDLPDLANHSSAGMRLAGHVVLCDWIASSEEFFDWELFRTTSNPDEYFALSCAMAELRVRELDLGRTDGKAYPNGLVEDPRPIQQALINHDFPPGLVIIEAPMGEGKTEAAWILAEKWREHGYRGTYMALPTMATSDSLYKRYQSDYLGKLNRPEATHLVHGMAWLRDDDGNAPEPEGALVVGEPDDRSSQDAAAAWFRPTRKAMLAAHGVGTVDQAMLAGMHVKFGFLRLYGLTERVLVIDEVHAYDAYMSAIICRLLQWCACLEIPVILLSATLSAKQREAMIEAYCPSTHRLDERRVEGAGGEGQHADYPLISAVAPGKDVLTIHAEASSTRTLRFETHPGLLGDEKKNARLAEKLVTHGGCCCVILNTVKQAQAVYRALGDDVPKLLFHARFTAQDRERIAKEVMEKFGKDTTHRPDRFVLVATQVVEQSLDVDFDHMITEIAPMDLLLQRSGRLHRHRIRATDPTLHVLTPGLGDYRFGGTGFVYASKSLLRTVALLAVRKQASLPKDFRTLVEDTYGEGRWPSPDTDWEAVEKADKEWNQEIKLLRSQGNDLALCKPNPRIFRPVDNVPEGDDSDDGNGWRAKTRLGANDRTCVFVSPAEGQALRAGVLSKKALKDLYRRSVKIARYLPLFTACEGFSPAIEAVGRLQDLLLLPMSEGGVWRGEDEKMNVYQIRYDEELGLLAGKIS